ncbi:MAG: hypothetical protein HYT08_03625 [Candidatus Levybacteria bacterium]|nr:hypothetical protein [Candidatus Levybacteria bacterium]
MAKATSAKLFSKKEAIKFGFSFFKENIVTFLKLGVVVILINFAASAITGGVKDSPIRFFWSIISIVISIAVQIGITKITLDLHDKKPLNLSYFYTLYHLILNYFIASIIYGVIVIAGLILLIAPGIIWAIKFQFYSFLIVDKGVGIMDSLKQSSKMTEGVKLNLLLFGGLLILINILGALALGIGLLVSIPTSLMATVYVYRKLLPKTTSVETS